ncbi:hypothetical protein BC828DRAFT_163692 [Blastocladiella britannica]|nr:hypothetical protein BC828DRAFT_163692 [Blastocladiella britannica]
MRVQMQFHFVRFTWSCSTASLRPPSGSDPRPYQMHHDLAVRRGQVCETVAAQIPHQSVNPTIGSYQADLSVVGAILQGSRSARTTRCWPKGDARVDLAADGGLLDVIYTLRSTFSPNKSDCTRQLPCRTSPDSGLPAGAQGVGADVICCGMWKPWRP